MKPGDRIRVIGRHHPWKGAVGRISRPCPDGLNDWYLVLDAPHGFASFGRGSAAFTRDLEPEDRPDDNALF